MSGATQTAAVHAGLLVGDALMLERALYLGVGGWTLCVRSNDAAVLDRLDRYFAHVRIAPCEADMDVLVVEREPPEPGVTFADWKREPGKQGRKDSYVDLVDGRLLRKVRTGMLFLQSESQRVAAGPCLRYDNQVINFINAQFMNRMQQHDWLICHASGLARDGAVLAIAGLSGGGKSTLMLQLLEDPAVAYLTNDRLFIKRQAGGVQAMGIPKLPRINPGTIVHSERLRPLIPEVRRRELLAMPQQALWELEEKHDVLVDEVYGAGRIAAHGRLAAFIVLDWQRDGDRPVRIEPAELAGRDDLLGAIMKSPGPFYQDAAGRFLADTDVLDAAAYHQALAGVPVYALGGTIDFTAAVKQIDELQWWRHA